MKDLIWAVMSTVLVTLVFVLPIGFAGKYVIGEKACKRYYRVTNTPTYYDAFGGCFIEVDGQWYLLDELRKGRE